MNTPKQKSTEQAKITNTKNQNSKTTRKKFKRQKERPNARLTKHHKSIKAKTQTNETDENTEVKTH